MIPGFLTTLGLDSLDRNVQTSKPLAHTGLSIHCTQQYAWNISISLSLFPSAPSRDVAWIARAPSMKSKLQQVVKSVIIGRCVAPLCRSPYQAPLLDSLAPRMKGIPWLLACTCNPHRTPSRFSISNKPCNYANHLLFPLVGSPCLPSMTVNTSHLNRLLN